MVDKLTFTTAVNISANPRVEFTPINDRFQFANANLKASADRIDRHGVAIGLAIAGIGVDEVAPIRRFGFSPDRGPGTIVPPRGRGARYGLYLGARVTGSGTPAERLAVEAIDQVKSREVQLIPSQ